MIELILLAFISLTVLIFILAYWPKTPQVPPLRSPSPGRAGQTGRGGLRVALVIGNGAYTVAGRLKNPTNDAGAVASTLTRLGFETFEKHDLGILQMREALRDFEDKANGADWALIYFAGHGAELGGRNWLYPIDIKLERVTDLPDEAIPAERVLDRLSGVRKLRMVIFDACRRNLLAARIAAMNQTGTRAVMHGLAPIEPRHGEVLFYAARHGTVASDGSGENSPFAIAFMKHMEEDGLELGRFFRRVTSSVLAATNKEQEPFLYGHIPDEEFYFKPPRAANGTP